MSKNSILYFAFRSATSGSIFFTAWTNGLASVICEPMWVCTPTSLQVLQTRGARVERGDFLEGDAELVLVRAGGDLGVGVGLHVRVHADGNGRALLLFARDLVDEIQFRDALDVERVDARGERLLDFRAGLADAGEVALRGLAAGLDARG
jgi:hypothetical protein